LHVDHGLLYSLKHLCLLARTCSIVGGGGGGGLTFQLFSPLLSSASLLLRFLVLDICSVSVHEIKNTQNNDSRGKGIVEKSIEIGEY
jgi:hypothetical protein